MGERIVRMFQRLWHLHNDLFLHMLHVWEKRWSCGRELFSVLSVLRVPPFWSGCQGSGANQNPSTERNCWYHRRRHRVPRFLLGVCDLPRSPRTQNRRSKYGSWIRRCDTTYDCNFRELASSLGICRTELYTCIIWLLFKFFYMSLTLSLINRKWDTFPRLLDLKGRVLIAENFRGCKRSRFFDCQRTFSPRIFECAHVRKVRQSYFLRNCSQAPLRTEFSASCCPEPNITYII